MSRIEKYEGQIKKLHYTIGEVAHKTSLSQSQIRQYCQEYDIDVSRDRRDERSFNDKAIHKLKAVSVLMKTVGYNSHGVRNYLRVHGWPMESELLNLITLYTQPYDKKKNSTSPSREATD